MGKSTDIPAEEQIARLVAQVESLSRDNERLARDNAELARAAAEAARGPAGLAEELRVELHFPISCFRAFRATCLMRRSAAD